VTFKGKFHTMESVAIVPPPVQRPIPIWFGGSSDAAIKRAARLGDGWMPIMAPDEAGEAALAKLKTHLKEFGRDPAKYGLEAWIRLTDRNEDSWGGIVAAWKRLGMQIGTLYPMYPVEGIDAQIDLLRRFKAVATG
jgi:alkanesulfonate monooxygenase SsuD/methylene tetrahydromethanopterin reductase-like flavin-dependent oxidoreductase (luciferase family)